MKVNNMSKDRLGEMIFLKYHLIFLRNSRYLLIFAK